jgi:hypothetical protein
MTVFKALCMRDCAQDAVEELGRPYCYYRAGHEYLIRDDSPVLPHFRPIEELPKKEGERAEAEVNLAKPVGRARKK